MATERDIRCMKLLGEMTDEEREGVLAWAAKKWPAKPQTAPSGIVGVENVSGGAGKEQRR